MTRYVSPSGVINYQMGNIYRQMPYEKSIYHLGHRRVCPAVSVTRIFFIIYYEYCYSKNFTTLILTSYNRYNGIVTSTSVIMSGGVMIAAKIIIIRKEWRR